MPRKYIITGGGTGGHVYPALAIAEALREDDPEAKFLYIGVRGRAEEQIVPRHGYELRFVIGAGMPGSRPSLPNLLAAVKLLLGLAQAAVILRRYEPDAVIGTGGYASVPAVLAAVLLRRLGLIAPKIFIHEQNFAPGRWNQLIGRWVDRVWISLEGSERFFPGSRVEYTGYPIRKEIHSEDRHEARRRLGLPEQARVIFAFGGSQGARTINRALVEALPRLLADPRVIVIHGTGGTKLTGYDPVRDTAARVEALGLATEPRSRYQVRDFYHDIQYYYAAADLVVCRGGAGTLNETCRCGRPAVVIPKSNLAGEHQVVNALALQRNGVCEVIFERPVLQGGRMEVAVSGETLARKALELLDDPERLARMGHSAAQVGGRADNRCFAASVRREQEGERLPVQPRAANGQVRQDDFDPAWLTRLSPSRVLQVAQTISSGADGRGVERHPLVETLRFFADGYLVSLSWQVRNSGVKLVGLLRHLERRGLLLEMAGDRTPASLWQRALGGDYRQVGFIRRNALDSLAELGLWDEPLRQLLLRVLADDPYYEARSHAARAIILLRDRIGGCAQLAAALERNLGHRSLEVRWCALEALGAVAPDPEFLQRQGKLLLHPNWRIREALLKAMCHLLARGVVRRGDPALSLLEGLMPTCTDFVPSFPLKRSLNRLRSLQAGAVAADSSTDSRENGR